MAIAKKSLLGTSTKSASTVSSKPSSPSKLESTRMVSPKIALAKASQKTAKAGLKTGKAGLKTAKAGLKTAKAGIKTARYMS